MLGFERLGEEYIRQAVVVDIGHRRGIAHRQQPFGHMLHTRIGALENIARRTAQAAVGGVYGHQFKVQRHQGAMSISGLINTPSGAADGAHQQQRTALATQHLAPRRLPLAQQQPQPAQAEIQKTGKK